MSLALLAVQFGPGFAIPCSGRVGMGVAIAAAIPFSWTGGAHGGSP